MGRKTQFLSAAKISNVADFILKTKKEKYNIILSSGGKTVRSKAKFQLLNILKITNLLTNTTSLDSVSEKTRNLSKIGLADDETIQKADLIVVMEKCLKIISNLYLQTTVEMQTFHK